VTKDQLLALSPAMALRVIVDCLDAETTKRIAAHAEVKVPLAPKFDMAIYRRDGVQWASETDLSGLRFWHKKASESAASGSQYAAKDQKKAANLERWIKWRECLPDVCWSGERNDQPITAPAPSARPMVYESKRSGAREPEPEPTAGTFGGADLDDSDIPF
jgi:hypothetical protein